MGDSLTVWLVGAGLAVLFPAVAAAWGIRVGRAGWRAWVCYEIARVHRSLLVSVEHVGVCTIPEEGPAIIVSNHTSPVDPILLWARHFTAFRRPHLRVIGYLTAREYFELPGFVNWVCRAMECIPVDRNGRDMQSVRQALERLKQGRLLGLFPEGRLNAESPDERLLAGDTGVAWLALKAAVPVIPIFIQSAPRSGSMVWVFFRRARVRLIYGQPLDLSAWRGRRSSPELLAEVTDHIMSSLAQLGGIGYTPCARPPAQSA
ncbi:MAG: 1-acyl-sn-glycerol-3-phosphate acyltransferase [Planctomycetota bacterium]|jgi:1-acyl-sn-glycerol-3-phosphate acyltransferase